MTSPLRSLLASPKSSVPYSRIRISLDIQELTTGSKRYSLQIQFSKETTIPTYKKVALRSWAKAEPPVGGIEWNAEEVRRELVKGIVVFR